MTLFEGVIEELAHLLPSAFERVHVRLHELGRELFQEVKSIDSTLKDFLDAVYRVQKNQQIPLAAYVLDLRVMLLVAAGWSWIQVVCQVVCWR